MRSTLFRMPITFKFKYLGHLTRRRNYARKSDWGSIDWFLWRQRSELNLLVIVGYRKLLQNVEIWYMVAVTWERESLFWVCWALRHTHVLYWDYIQQCEHLKYNRDKKCGISFQLTRVNQYYYEGSIRAY